jgi:non-homologous end joining protein Ku
VKRAPDDLSSEVTFLKKHLKTTFNRDISLDQFNEHLNQIIHEKVTDYIYQRYRDWSAFELLDLLAEFKRSLEPKPEVKIEPRPEFKEETQIILKKRKEAREK